MNKKIRHIIGGVFLILIIVSLSCVAFGSSSRYRGRYIQFIDEDGQAVNMTTSASLYIYKAGTTDELICYLTAEGTQTVSQPITDDSANTPLDYSNGVLKFYAATGNYKIVATNGTYTRTFDNLTDTDTFITWYSYQTVEDIGDADTVMATHEGTYDHNDIATALQPDDIGVTVMAYDANILAMPVDPDNDYYLKWDDTNGVLVWAEAGTGTGDANAVMADHNAAYDHNDIATAVQAETDPCFAAWDKSTGISITESQISDLKTYLTAETDPCLALLDINSVDVTNWNNAYVLAQDANTLATDVNTAVDAIPDYNEVQIGTTLQVVAGVLDINDSYEGSAADANNVRSIIEADPNIVTQTADIGEPIFRISIPEPNASIDVDIQIPILYDYTITHVIANIKGGTNVVARLYEVDTDGIDDDKVGIESSDWTFTETKTDDTSFNNATIDAGDWLQLDITSVSGEVTKFNLAVYAKKT